MFPFPAQYTPYPEKLQFTEVIPPSHTTSATTVESEWLDIGEFEGNIALGLLAAQATAGTTPTLNVSIEHRVDSSDTPAAIPATSLQDGDGNNATFTEVTDAAGGGLEVLTLIRAELRAQIKVTVTLAGTSTPTFDFAMFLCGSNKYGAQ